MSTNVLDPATPLAVFEPGDELREAEHEQVAFCRDERTGLRAIIAIHDTTLGPGLGGTRYFPYDSEALTLTDVLRLSEGMTYKAAAGMPLGGTKAVIIGDPAVHRTEALLEAYGRFVESLGGRYRTVADVGTTSSDLDVIGRATRHVVGRSIAQGGSGDSGYHNTALGVFSALRAVSGVAWGHNGAADKTVGVEGVGKVGRHLVDLLLDAGARVIVSDPRSDALASLGRSAGSVTSVPSVIAERLDVYAPVHSARASPPQSVETLAARVVCGAANNQLLHCGVAELLRLKSIHYVPDYGANAGGLIQVGSELTATPSDAVRVKVKQIEGTTREILDLAADSGVTTGEAARRLADSCLHAARCA